VSSVLSVVEPFPLTPFALFNPSILASRFIFQASADLNFLPLRLRALSRQSAGRVVPCQSPLTPYIGIR